MTEVLVAGAFNFRDTGGLPAAGGETRAGVLFRSGNLAHVTDAGRARLRELRLRRVIDLRDEAEVAYEPSALEGLDLTVQRVPLFAGSPASFLAQDMTLSMLYAGLVERSAPGIVDVVRGVLADQPVLVHCTVGKDRTGVTVALALAAAGVHEDAVVADYARSAALLPPERNARIVAYLQSAHPEAQNLVELATLSPAEVMRGLLDDLRARYGSPAGFLQESGLGDDEIAELRRVLVRDA